MKIVKTKVEKSITKTIKKLFPKPDPCPCCGNKLRYGYMHPPIYDKNIKSWKLDKNGIIFQDKTRSKIKVPFCENCHRGFRIYFL
jgi:hypothetical protein